MILKFSYFSHRTTNGTIDARGNTGVVTEVVIEDVVGTEVKTDRKRDKNQKIKRIRKSQRERKMEVLSDHLQPCRKEYV